MSFPTTMGFVQLEGRTYLQLGKTRVDTALLKDTRFWVYKDNRSIHVNGSKTITFQLGTLEKMKRFFPLVMASGSKFNGELKPITIEIIAVKRDEKLGGGLEGQDNNFYQGQITLGSSYSPLNQEMAEFYLPSLVGNGLTVVQKTEKGGICLRTDVAFGKKQYLLDYIERVVEVIESQVIFAEKEDNRAVQILSVAKKGVPEQFTMFNVTGNSVSGIYFDSSHVQCEVYQGLTLTKQNTQTEKKEEKNPRNSSSKGEWCEIVTFPSPLSISPESTEKKKGKE